MNWILDDNDCSKILKIAFHNYLMFLCKDRKMVCIVKKTLQCMMHSSLDCDPRCFRQRSLVRCGVTAQEV